MNRRAIASLLAGLAALGCGPRNLERGRIGFLSSHALSMPMRIVAPEVEGEFCTTPGSSSGDFLTLALMDALAKAPGANALANASIEQSPWLCFVVRGTAVAIGTTAPEARAVPAAPHVAPATAASP